MSKREPEYQLLSCATCGQKLRIEISEKKTGDKIEVKCVKCRASIPTEITRSTENTSGFSLRSVIKDYGQPALKHVKAVVVGAEAALDEYLKEPTKPK